MSRWRHPLCSPHHVAVKASPEQASLRDACAYQLWSTMRALSQWVTAQVRGCASSCAPSGTAKARRHAQRAHLWRDLLAAQPAKSVNLSHMPLLSCVLQPPRKADSRWLRRRRASPRWEFCPNPAPRRPSSSPLAPEPPQSARRLLRGLAKLDAEVSAAVYHYIGFGGSHGAARRCARGLRALPFLLLSRPPVAPQRRASRRLARARPSLSLPARPAC